VYCSLKDLLHDLVASHHVSHNKGAYGLLRLQAEQTRLFCARIEQAFRMLCSPTGTPPPMLLQREIVEGPILPTGFTQQDPTPGTRDLTAPLDTSITSTGQYEAYAEDIDKTRDSLSSSDTGGGTTVEEDIIITIDDHTISVSPSDLVKLGQGTQLTEEAIKNTVPIRLSIKCTKAQRDATPGDGYCGLHVLCRPALELSSEGKQRPDYEALQHLIVTELQPSAQSDEWGPDNSVPPTTRAYLSRILSLLSSGRKYASRADYMPLEALQLLIQRSPTSPALWIPDSATSDVLWLTTTSGQCSFPTMQMALDSLPGFHIGYSREHFFQTAPRPKTVRALVDAMGSAIARRYGLPGDILPMEVEDDAILVRCNWHNWALASSSAPSA
jgi:hypothetical protein